MKNYHLLKERFRIGEQFYNWEFELDFLPERVQGYDSFIYIGNNTLCYLGFCVDEVELLFNADFLTAVILTLKVKDECDYEKLKEKFVSVGYTDLEIVSGYICFSSNTKNTLLYYVTKNYPIKVIYGKRRFMKKHLPSLLAKTR